jgi:predicted NACHT family NTPase
MGRRSLRASSQGIQDIKKALKRKKWSQTYIAGTVDCSRQTIWSLLQGNPTDCDVFMEVCTQLGLNWEEIAEPESPEPEQNDSQDIDALVREVRQRVQPYIQERCGTMRVLDMNQPIALGDIYTSVNILDKITGRRGLELSELMRDADPEKFERFCLGNVREQRVPGLKAVETFSKLMILGKPGAGKTTFLKHLAIHCIGGKFQGDRVPVFVTLKDFAEADGKPGLLEYIDQLIATNPVGARYTVPLPTILGAGKALILLDGLDEVRDADSSRVLRQIQEFSQQFPQNQFVITCRIAAKEYTFERFTEVEIADFDDKQIANFSGKWFRSKNDPIKAERFLQRLKKDAPIRELATNPLLLTLLCLVFEDCGSFPINRAELYQTGVDVLLKKWDVKRNIEREQVYKRLSLKRKEDLLSQIARTSFEAGNYFFKQREVERYITQYIQNLPDASTDPEALELDSAAVLKSIEAQHGLFVGRARGIYSFSHLTFHEYFAARKIVTSCNPYAIDDPTLQGLVSHITQKRWREVFLLTVGMLDSADAWLQLMKARIDGLLAGDEKLQQFLNWVRQKSDSINNSYKAAAIRALYFVLGNATMRSTDRFLDDVIILHPAFNLAFSIDSILEKSLELDVDACGIGIDILISSVIEIAILISDDFPNITVKNANVFGVVKDNDTNIIKSFVEEIISRLINNLNNSLMLKINTSLKRKIKSLKKQLPISNVKNSLDVAELIQWMQGKGSDWSEKLKLEMAEHRNIGHDWQFSNEQKKLLEQYYDANKLLVDCLNSDCYVSREVRQEIEETLLLPISVVKH